MEAEAGEAFIALGAAATVLIRSFGPRHDSRRLRRGKVKFGVQPKFCRRTFFVSGSAPGSVREYHRRACRPQSELSEVESKPEVNLPTSPVFTFREQNEHCTPFGFC